MSYRTELASARTALLVAALLFAGVEGAGAVEFEYGFTTRAGYSSNLFRRVEGLEEGAFSFRVGPDLALVDRTGTLQWKLRYRVDYEWFAGFSDVNGFNQDLVADALWRISEQTELSFRDQFRKVRAPQTLNEQILVGQDTFVNDLVFTARPITRNDLEIALTHRFSDRHLVRLQGVSALVRYDDANGVDTDVLVASASYSFLLTRLTTIGLGVDYTRQDFTRPTAPDSGTTFFNGYVSLTHQFDPTLIVRIAGGPTWIDPDSVDQTIDLGEAPLIPLTTNNQGSAALVDVLSCPTLSDGTPTLDASCSALGFALFREDVAFIEGNLVPLTAETSAVSGGSTTYFARASIAKTWRNVEASLVFSRDATLAGGTIGSTISNVFSASASWRPSPRWRVSVIGSYVLRQSSSEPFSVAQTLGSTTYTSPVGPRPPAQNVAERTGLRTVTVSSDFENQIYLARLDVTRDLSRWLSVKATAFYNHQELSGAGREDRTIPGWTLFFSLTYRFEPVHIAGI